MVRRQVPTLGSFDREGVDREGMRVGVRCRSGGTDSDGVDDGSEDYGCGIDGISSSNPVPPTRLLQNGAYKKWMDLLNESSVPLFRLHPWDAVSHSTSSGEILSSAKETKQTNQKSTKLTLVCVHKPIVFPCASKI